MKSINYRIFTAALIALIMIGVGACSDPDMPEPMIDTEALPIKTNVNNVKVGTSLASGEAWSGYQNVEITANGVFANTNLRAKATSGQIGGELKANDLIYRAGSNNSNNFQASANLSYTIITVDSRPKPVRTLNANGVGDVTYYSPIKAFVAPSKLNALEDTTIVLTTNNSIVTANLVKKYNGNVLPSFLTPLGIVPLGSSDPGGIRFYLLQDLFPTGQSRDQSAGAFSQCADITHETCAHSRCNHRFNRVWSSLCFKSKCVQPYRGFADSNPDVSKFRFEYHCYNRNTNRIHT
jgi:hypothetical protein